MTNDFSSSTMPELLAAHAQISDELRNRGIVRTSNNPTGDLAEYLFCKAFAWTQADNSSKHIDAVCSDGVRYQIKGRRVTKHNPSRQLSALRSLSEGHFDFLAGVIFNEDYSVWRAALIPHALVLSSSAFTTRTNSHRFLLRDSLWEQDGVRDVTEALRAVVY